MGFEIDACAVLARASFPFLACRHKMQHHRTDGFDRLTDRGPDVMVAYFSFYIRVILSWVYLHLRVRIFLYISRCAAPAGLWLVNLCHLVLSISTLQFGVRIYSNTFIALDSVFVWDDPYSRGAVPDHRCE